MSKLSITEVEQLSSAILQALDRMNLHDTDDDIVLAAIQEAILDHFANVPELQPTHLIHWRWPNSDRTSCGRDFALDNELTDDPTAITCSTCVIVLNSQGGI